MLTLRKSLSSLLCAAALVLTLTACSTSKLATGGAYAPTSTNAAGQVTALIEPDYAFFVADSAFDLAHATLNAAFQFEFDNRVLLWKVSPQIKHTLDGIRPQAVQAEKAYAAARFAYLLTPIPTNLSLLQSALAHAQQIAAAATAALPKTTP